jgi:hypothetical protein
MTTAISTAVSTVVAAMFKWGGGFLARLRARITPDHRPLHAGEWPLASSLTGSVRFRALIACAPSHSLRQTEVDPNRAIQLVRTGFPEHANAEPQRSLPQSGVKFAAAAVDGDEPYVWVWKCGRD